MRVTYGENISWQKIGNAIYVVEEKQNLRYKLEGTAKEIWVNLNMSDIDTLAHQFCTQYANADEERIYNDIKLFINELLQRGLIGEIK